MSEIEDELAEYLQDSRNMAAAGDRGWCSRLMMHMRHQDSHIAELEAELERHRWVPVSEGLPGPERLVDAVAKHGDVDCFTTREHDMAEFAAGYTYWRYINTPPTEG